MQQYIEKWDNISQESRNSMLHLVEVIEPRVREASEAYWRRHGKRNHPNQLVLKDVFIRPYLTESVPTPGQHVDDAQVSAVIVLKGGRNISGIDVRLHLHEMELDLELEKGDLAVLQENVQHEVITSTHIDCAFEERWSCILFYTVGQPKDEETCDDDE